MNKKSGFLTFLTALVPGIGYMYLGLIKKGVEALAIWMLIAPIFNFVMLGRIGSIFKVIFWAYTFFDTFNVAGRLKRGEMVADELFITHSHNGEFSKEKYVQYFEKINKNSWYAIAWLLIIVGILAILNNVFQDLAMYEIIRYYVQSYFVPVILVVAGIYLLVKDGKLRN